LKPREDWNEQQHGRREDGDEGDGPLRCHTRSLAREKRSRMRRPRAFNMLNKLFAEP
jgi:hypothetical protein